ncbi:DUF4232 domain-containing protein [Serratia nevei]|uniref:DUF4232 domain-containing protein n=1 Tax=Serratia nevei TaxID=2703794 RepID=UPI00313DA3C3
MRRQGCLAMRAWIKTGRYFSPGAAICAFLLYGCTLLPSGARAVTPEVGACEANQLDAKVVDRDGLEGAQMVLRNASTQPCHIKKWPVLAFEGDDGEPLIVERRIAPQAASGPASANLTLAPGEAVSALLSWENRDIDKVHSCMTPLMAVVDLPGGALRFLFGRQMCAAGGSLTVLTQGALMPQEKGR